VANRIRQDLPLLGRRSAGLVPALCGESWTQDLGALGVKHRGTNSGSSTLLRRRCPGKLQRENPRAFAAVVLTDYVPHPIGVPPNLDLYIVADEAAAEIVTKLGVPEEKIHPTGIPIDPVFDRVRKSERGRGCERHLRRQHTVARRRRATGLP
jgi:monogalactosyldiacylglycerol (MGDG) synthase